jgi:hypothetical protein
MSQNAVVTTTLPDGTVQTAECLPDDYVLVTGPEMYVANLVTYGNGTVVLTLKVDKP